MTVKTLIEKLSHYNKDAIVRLHHREGEELLFALAFQNDDTTVVLETENDNDMREEIQARFRAWQYPLTDDINLEYRRKFRIFIR